MALAPGSRLGPYDVVGSIGAGGMGEVYRARDPRLDRDVALKILPASFAADPERLARFEREAKTLASLNHPHIAQIYGIEEGSGIRALVMELVEGEDLSLRIARGAIPIDEAVPIARQIAGALEAAHDLGIIHRDLKPANVKLRSDGTVKVLDFGLAKALDHREVSGMSPALANSPTITTPAMTQAGMILGTAAYMSPEQAKGRVVDRRTDLWAFGCVLFEMLTGQRAFAGEDVTDTLTAIFRDEPQWSALPSHTPATVQRLLRRCLQKDRARRLDSAAMARIELDETAGPDASAVVAARRTASPWLWVLGATTIAALVVAVIVLTRPAPVAGAPVIRFALPLPPTLPLRAIPGGSAVIISPDGKYVVYTSGSEGELVRRRLDGEDFDVFKERGVAPFFSPDSKWIGFFAEGRLKKMPVEGGLATPICNAGNGRGTWGDDDTIVFANPSGLFRVPSSGGEPQAILPPFSGPGPVRIPQPVFVPGSQIVLVPNRDGAERIQALTLADGTFQDVTDGLNPVYADDRQFVFVKDSQLWAAPFDAKRAALRGPPAPVLEGFRIATTYPLVGVASDGTIVYMPGDSVSRSTMVWLDRKGQATPALAESDSYLEPRLSPDGTRVAVAITKAGRFDLWVYDLARGTKLRLTSSGTNTRPRWTPDGVRIAFASEGDLYVRRADGSGPAESLLIRPVAQFPDAWTPDGQSVIYNEGGATRDLWMVPSGQQPVRLMPESPFSERSGSVSPDGKWLAFVSNESGRDEIYVQPFPGPGAKIAISTGGAFAPVWARDGRELYYRGLDAMMVVPIGKDLTRAGAPWKLFDFPIAMYGRDPNRVEYDVAPDGRFLAVRLNAQSAGEEMRVVTNWLANRMRAAATTRP
jgi:hypothetical protein